MLFEILSTLSAGLFSGAAIYINFVEHPARKECGTNLAITEFGASYRRGAVFMGSLLLTGFLSALAVWYRSSSPGWLIGGGFLLVLIPFTLILVFPINKRLLDGSIEKDSVLAAQLLTRWGKLHAVRSLLGLTSFMIFTFLLLRSTPR